MGLTLLALLYSSEPRNHPSGETYLYQSALAEMYCNASSGMFGDSLDVADIVDVSDTMPCVD